MAKKTQESLLGEMIQLLRKQNQLTTRDRLKEAEEVKRLEKQDEERDLVTMDGQGNIIDSREDFGRRIKANIAGKEYGWKRKAPAEAKKKKTQGVIAHATHMTRRLIEKANSMTYRWRIEETRDDLRRWKQGRADRKQDKRDGIERDREDEGEFFDFTKKLRKSFAAFLSPRELARQKRKEEWSVIKENWFKYGVIPLIGILTVSIGLAYAGIHLWHTKVWAALKSVKVWATGKWFKTGMFLDMKYIALRTSIYKWFGYDKAGKPMFKKVGGEWKMFGWAGMVEGIKTRLANLRLKAYNSMGLGVDGKPVAQRYTGGPRASMPVRAAWTSFGFAGLVTRRIGKMLKPLVNISGGIAKWTGGSVYKGIANTLKSFMKLGAVKFIGRMLWPIAAIFSIFEGFKAGKAEAGKEDSKWYTVFGEAAGGVIGYLAGGLADAIKNIAVWGIRKMFGLEVDENGQIIKGQGLGGDALAAIQKFSFMDLIHKLVAFPFHALSATIDFIGKLFTDPVGMAKGMWEWITDMPRRIGNWFKGMIPEKVRKFFGIEFSEYDVKGKGQEESYISDAAKNYYTTVEYKKRMGIDPKQATPGLQAKLDKQRDLYLEIANQRNAEAFEFRTQRAIDISNGAIDPMTLKPYGHVTNVNFHYKDEGYGDYVKAQRLETMGM